MTETEPKTCEICLAGPSHPEFREHVLEARESWIMGASPDAYCPAWHTIDVFLADAPIFVPPAPKEGA